MTQNNNTPQLRFSGFRTDWEEQSFSDITFLAGEKNHGNLPLESFSISNEKGFVPQAEQFENGGTMKDADKRMYYIVTPKTFAYNPARINVGSIGYHDLDKNVIVSSLYEVFKTNDVIDDRFLWQWFKSDAFKKMIEQYQEGGVRLYFYYDKLCKCVIPVPDILEQQRIGAVLDTIDQIILMSKQKYNKLCSIKGSMLEKMFPKDGADVPEVRFKGFEGPWERKPAVELFAAYVDKGHPELPVLSATQDAGMVIRDALGKSVFHEVANEVGYKRVLPGQFVIHLRSFQGGFAHSAIEGITSPAYTVFGFKEPEKHDDYFWKYIFMSKQFIKRLETVTYGIRDGRSISYDEFLTLDFLFPQKEEQSLICQYLLKLDSLIAMRKQELDKLQSLKKAMLEKMFV